MTKLASTCRKYRLLGIFLHPDLKKPTKPQFLLMKNVLLIAFLTVIGTVAWAQRDKLLSIVSPIVTTGKASSNGVVTPLNGKDVTTMASSEDGGDGSRKNKKTAKTLEDYQRLAAERSHLTSNLPAPFATNEEQLSEEVMRKVQTITTVINTVVGLDSDTDAKIFEINKTAARMASDVHEKYSNNPTALSKEIREIEQYRDRKIMQILSSTEQEKFAKIMRIPTSDDTPGNKGLEAIYNF